MSGLTLETLLSDLGEELKISVEVGEEYLKEIEITTERLSRPGLFLSGYEDHFDSRRIQIIGNTEYSYLLSLPYEKRCERLKRLMESNVPALVFTRGNKPPECIKKMSKRTVILLTQEYTPIFQRKLYDYLCFKLAPSITVHGTMVDVYDLGILLTGKSGSGKSECALDLISQGFSLIADDVVRLIEYPKGSVMGTVPRKEDVFRNIMEIRGVGIIDVFSTFGIGAVKDRKKLDLVIELVMVEPPANIDRFILRKDYTEYFSVKVDKVVLPVIPGRHISAIIKTLALDYRLKIYGYNATRRVEEYLRNQHD